MQLQLIGMKGLLEFTHLHNSLMSNYNINANQFQYLQAIYFYTNLDHLCKVPNFYQNYVLKTPEKGIPHLAVKYQHSC